MQQFLRIKLLLIKIAFVNGSQCNYIIFSFSKLLYLVQHSILLKQAFKSSIYKL